MPKSEPQSEPQSARRGRPLRSEGGASKPVSVSFTPEELDELDGTWRAGGFKSRSEYLRAVALGRPLPRRRTSGAVASVSPELLGGLFTLRYELKKIGTNLNQLTRVANERKQVRLLDLLVDVVASLESKARAVEDLHSQLFRWSREVLSPSSAKRGGL